jgi:hypothetical protein
MTSKKNRIRSTSLHLAPTFQNCARNPGANWHCVRDQCKLFQTMRRLAIGCFVLLVACCAHEPRLTVVLNRMFQGDHGGQITCGIASSSQPDEVCLYMSGFADCTTSGELWVEVIAPPESKLAKKDLGEPLSLEPRSFEGFCFPAPRTGRAVVTVTVETKCLNNPDKIRVTTKCTMP